MRDAPPRVAQTDRLPPEGYELEITPDEVRLQHRDENGRRYGLATLGQIREQAADRLPGLRISDWPDFPVRGFMLDISRDRVPTRATLERLVGLLVLARINQLQLYIEHTFAYREHEVVWRDASPLTADDVRWLDDLCRGAGIELVANQNCFGHMNRWLQHEAYRQRAEAPDGFELLPGVRLPPSVLAPTPENAAFALDLFDELLPNFSSRRVNVGFDEPFELGRGASRAEVERRGRVAVYVEHLRRIADPLLAQGYEVLFCDDVVRHEPQLAAELPDEMVTLAWTYEAPPAGGERPALPPEIASWMERAGISSADDHVGFATRRGTAGRGRPALLGDAGDVELELAGRARRQRPGQPHRRGRGGARAGRQRLRHHRLGRQRAPATAVGQLRSAALRRGSQLGARRQPGSRCRRGARPLRVPRCQLRPGRGARRARSSLGAALGSAPSTPAPCR